MNCCAQALNCSHSVAGSVASSADASSTSRLDRVGSAAICAASSARSAQRVGRLLAGLVHARRQQHRHALERFG